VTQDAKTGTPDHVDNPIGANVFVFIVHFFSPF
jgi:hypothetical protein